jgi:hypothetical protein
MHEEAFEFLNMQSEAFIDDVDSMYMWLLNDPIYDDFRDDPRFQKILVKHKEIYEENLKKYGDVDI